MFIRTTIQFLINFATTSTLFLTTSTALAIANNREPVGTIKDSSCEIFVVTPFKDSDSERLHPEALEVLIKKGYRLIETTPSEFRRVYSAELSKSPVLLLTGSYSRLNTTTWFEIPYAELRLQMKIIRLSGSPENPKPVTISVRTEAGWHIASGALEPFEFERNAVRSLPSCVVEN